MTRLLPAIAAALLPTALAAHDTSGVPHVHPHGFEWAILLAALAVLAAILVWRRR
jgi:MYXO-CTERM domain-containing protein